MRILRRNSLKSKRGKTNEENYRIHICFYTCRITFADLVREKKHLRAVGGDRRKGRDRQRGEIKLEPDKFTFYGVQMGMTTDQVQVSVGKAAQVYARNDKMFLTEDIKVNEFKNGLDRVVYYIFNTNNQLVEVQYVVSSSDGVSYQNAVTLFRGIYGPDGIEIQSEIGKRETIWEYMDVYVIVARNDEKDVVISYMQKSLFETENKKDVEKYNETKQGRK